MQMLYNSDSYVVVQFTVPEDNAPDAVTASAAGSPPAQHTAAMPTFAATGRGGYEIVDKLARKEIYLQGALAQSFQRGVQALAEQEPNEEAIDDFIAGFTVLAQQALLLH